MNSLHGMLILCIGGLIKMYIISYCFRIGSALVHILGTDLRTPYLEILHSSALLLHLYYPSGFTTTCQIISK